MKRLILIALFSISSVAAFAQSVSEIGMLALDVVVPEDIKELDGGNLAKMRAKINQVVTKSGMLAGGYGKFIIYPDFSQYKVDKVEGGMQTIHVVTADLGLFIKQSDNGVVFSSVSKSIKGSGMNEKAALADAISKIKPDDKDFKAFMETAESKIIAYYEQNCNQIMRTADDLVKKKDHESALGLLMTVPSEMKCYTTISAKSIEIYNAYQKVLCSQLIKEAREHQAVKEYKESVEVISRIDPASPCIGEAQNLLKQAEQKIDQQEKDNIALYLKIYDNAAELERYRINAIKEIAVAYYKRRR